MLQQVCPAIGKMGMKKIEILCRLSKQTYLDRNNKIKDYFSGNPNFLVLDINDDNKFEKLCGFLNKEVPNTPYPYMNYNGN